MVKGDRVEIPEYMDWWMKGARFGVVTRVFYFARDNRAAQANVKLDKTNRVIRVIAKDCRVI